MKLQKISQSITPFAGISFVTDEFKNYGLVKLIDAHLSTRCFTGNQYSEIFRAWFSIFLSGSDVAEDISCHLREGLESFPGNRVQSADAMLRGIKELVTENDTVVSSSGKQYQFNINLKMNRLNLISLLLTKQLKKGKYYDFDYDNQIIAHEKYDVKPTYKKNTGYFPDAGTIGDKIVYVEGCDGNANVKTGQAETLKRAYGLLRDGGVYVDRSRMDACSYAEEIVEVVNANSRLFYIRANRCGSLTERIREIKEWEVVEINNKKYEVASLSFTSFMTDSNFRLVISWEKNADGQADLFTGDVFIYRSILTNDHVSTKKEVIEY